MSYKRKILLINPKFQTRLAFIVCSVILVSNLVYPIAIITVFEEFFHAVPALKNKYDPLLGTLTWILFSYEFLYLAGIYMVMIFIGHKIAGPLYKLKNYLSNIAEGNPPETIKFRKGDYFMEIEEQYNAALAALKNQHLEDTKYLEEVIPYLKNIELIVPEDKKPVINEIITRLTQVKNRFEPEI
ncbi:MAG: hypothetical protein JNM93_03200 [Bacteriovoracaceae bacterium]|nr:hypothetical protein [Bacteriovoracaceae bacterium]